MRRTYLGIGVVCLGIVCSASVLFGSSHAPPRPHTYHAAVVQALDRRGMAYTTVWVGGLCQPEAQCWESPYGSWYNSAPVYVADAVVYVRRPDESNAPAPARTAFSCWPAIVRTPSLCRRWRRNHPGCGSSGSAPKRLRCSSVPGFSAYSSHNRAFA